jgi:hypothetical protein
MAAGIAIDVLYSLPDDVGVGSLRNAVGALGEKLL